MKWKLIWVSCLWVAVLYAQLQWDLIRSVRVVLDVALNYYGWSDEQALEFWNQHIQKKKIE